jgi:hypothetical protein
MDALHPAVTAAGDGLRLGLDAEARLVLDAAALAERARAALAERTR